MARNVSLNGTSFTIPQTGDSGWSLTGGVDDYLVALASGVLTKAGGSFTLTADVNLGAAKGLIGPYYTSATAGAAASGVVRLAKTDAVGWRNNAGAADLALAIDGSDNLTFNGLKVGLSGNIVNADISPSAAIAYSKLALSNSIVNSDIASAAAIAYSKLALSGSIVNADVSASAAIAYSKLSLGGSIVNSDVSGTAAIAYSKLNLATSIQNSDVSATAAIAYSKLNLAASIATADLAAGLLVPVAKGGTGVTTSTGTGSVVLSSSPALTTPSFSSIVNTGTLTLPTSTDTLVGRATTDTLTNKTLSGNIATNLVSGAATITLPTTTGTLATLANAETLTNKTLSTGTSITAGKITTAVAEVDPADNTKQWNATLSAAATATATTFAFAQTANRTLTMPDATDTLVGRATTDTLTNKSISGGTHTGITSLGIRDTSAAFDVTYAHVSSIALTAPRTLTFDVQNASQTLKTLPLSNFSTLADGSSGQVLSTLGSGSGYAWASALTSVLNQYNVSVGNASNAATATNTNLLGNVTAQVRSQTATVTIATPGVFTSNGHGMANGDKFYLTTNGALPTGLVANTTYYAANVTANTFSASTSYANAIAGTYIATSGSQSGIHTLNMGGLTLNPGPAANRAPTQQTFTSGSGTYTTPANVAWLRVRMVGGGGGGAGGGTSGGAETAGSAGGNTTFGSSFLTANGGGGGTLGANTAGGATTINTGAVGLGIQGASGNGLSSISAGGGRIAGGMGASSALGGGGGGGGVGSVGVTAATNSGSGGGGGSFNATSQAGAGGGGGSAGGFIDVIIANPSATYSYAIGAAGNAGVGDGTNGASGGAGATGIIIVEEHYY